jgi:apolipoprotein N-acyltransferase
MPHWFAPWKLRARVGALNGWQAALLLFLAGAVSALAMAPYHVWPLLAVGLIVLMWSVDRAHGMGQGLKSAFFRGFMFGFGYFLAGTFWLSFAFITRGPEFIPLIPLALPLFSGFLALYWGGAMVLYKALRHRSEWRILGFAASIALFEWIRAHLFSGLPWNMPAYAWPAGGAVSQAASWFGVYGLTLLTILILASPAVSVSRSGAVTRLFPPLAGMIILTVLIATGSARIPSGASPVRDDVTMRIVQLAMTQEEKWGPGGFYLARQRYLELTRQPGIENVSHVLWAEGALPRYYVLQDAETLGLIDQALPPETLLLAGVNRAVEVPEQDDEYVFYNSLTMMNFEGLTPRFTQYDKALLVPFGEFIPFAALIDAIGFSDFARQQFTAGSGQQVMDTGRAGAMMPLICYEAIFPRYLQGAPERPDWLYNLSNDAWFGETSGPAQHLIQSQYRSIEAGLPMVRTAVRGVSGVVDPFGRMAARIERLDEGAHDVSLPLPIAATPYVRWGNLPFWVVCIAIFAGIFGVRRFGEHK